MMTPAELRRAAELLDDHAEYDYAMEPDCHDLARKLRAEADAENIRTLAITDPYCPSCGHNRNRSSVSTIDNMDGSHSCQMCGIRWKELPPGPEA